MKFHPIKKYVILISSIVLMAITSNLNAAAIAKECSIKLPAVHFTKCLNGAEKNAALEKTKVTLKSDAKKDFFNDTDGKTVNSSAPVLLSRVDNTKPFTFTAKVNPQFKETYDAGALYVFHDEKLWQKFAFERDERANTRIVSVRTIETSDDCNHQPIADQAVYLKISSDTKTIAFYFSTDNRTWNLARLYKNNYPEIIWLGISSQSPMGEGNVTQFEDLVLTEQSVKDFRMGI